MVITWLTDYHVNISIDISLQLDQVLYFIINSHRMQYIITEVRLKWIRLHDDILIKDHVKMCMCIPVDGSSKKRREGEPIKEFATHSFRQLPPERFVDLHVNQRSCIYALQQLTVSSSSAPASPFKRPNTRICSMGFKYSHKQF